MAAAHKKNTKTNNIRASVGVEAGVGGYQAMLLELHHAAPAHRHGFDDLG